MRNEATNDNNNHISPPIIKDTKKKRKRHYVSGLNRLMGFQSSSS